jgi:hypothetical protein
MGCKDEEFVRYMEQKWSDHEDMTRVLTSTELMEFALKRYQTSVEQQTWGVDSKQTKTIMNLTAKVGTINKWKKDQGKGKDTKATANPDKKEFLPIDEWRKKQYNKAPAWKKKAPTNLTDTKKVKGTTLHWCVHHKMWQQHESDKCRIIKKKQDDKKDDKKGKEKEEEKKDDKAKADVKYNAKAMIAEVDDDSEDSY